MLSTILFVTAILAIAFSLFELQRTATITHSLYEMEQERQTCDTAIQQMMDGSDYLTMQVQQFAVKGERVYMDSYWKEVNQTQSRDAALATILGSDITPEERQAAIGSKNESDSLIQGEIRAMRLVSESVGIAEADMPADVAAFPLDPQDAALTAEQKRASAVAYVFGPDYSISKDTIRSNVNAFRNELTNRYAEASLAALAKTEAAAIHMAAGLVVLFLLLLGMIAYFAGLVVSPLVAFSRELNGSKPGETILLPEHGALEISQLAQAFNAVSAQAGQNRKRLERLGCIDYLTDAPNRASITEYVSDMIAQNKQPLGVMIVDIDNFKHFNDTYGHALGDQVLRQVAHAVCSVQPAEQGISGRLCGEEFVVVSREADEAALRKTAETILQNVRSIAADAVGLPDAQDFGVTVSVGGMIWRGERPADFIRLLSMADKALYESKNSGKDRYTFYGGARAQA